MIKLHFYRWQLEKWKTSEALHFSHFSTLTQPYYVHLTQMSFLYDITCLQIKSHAEPWLSAGPRFLHSDHNLKIIRLHCFIFLSTFATKEGNSSQTLFSCYLLNSWIEEEIISPNVKFPTWQVYFPPAWKYPGMYKGVTLFVNKSYINYIENGESIR